MSLQFSMVSRRHVLQSAATGVAAIMFGRDTSTAAESETAAAAPPSSSVKDDEEGFRPLFDGKSFAGWKVNENTPKSWQIENGLLVLTGGNSHLFTTEEFDDFIVRFEWRPTKKGYNSGFLLRRRTECDEITVGDRPGEYGSAGIDCDQETAWSMGPPRATRRSGRNGSRPVRACAAQDSARRGEWMSGTRGLCPQRPLRARRMSGRLPAGPASHGYRLWSVDFTDKRTLCDNRTRSRWHTRRGGTASSRRQST